MKFLKKIIRKIKVKITYNDKYLNEEMNPEALKDKALEKMNKDRLNN